MAGILSRLNQGIRDAFARSDTTAEAPRPSGASTASRVMNRRTTGDEPPHNGWWIAAAALATAPPAFASASAPARRIGAKRSRHRKPGSNAACTTIYKPVTARVAGEPRDRCVHKPCNGWQAAAAPLPRRPPLQNAAAQTVAETASAANRAFEIVAEQAEITSRNIDRRVETTVAQLQRDINAFNTHPPYVAHVAAAAAQGTAAQHLEAAGQALHAAQARANTHEAEIQGRMAAATLAAEAGHPEQLQQLTLDTLAVQAAVNGAQQAALTAAEEFMAGNAMVRITAAAGEAMAATRQELVLHAQNLAQLEET